MPRRLDYLIALAGSVIEHNLGRTTDRIEVQLARWVLDLLGESHPCGYEAIPVVSMGDGTCGVLVDDRGDALSVSEARAYAAMVLRAADEAEERNT